MNSSICPRYTKWILAIENNILCNVPAGSVGDSNEANMHTDSCIFILRILKYSERLQNNCCRKSICNVLNGEEHQRVPGIHYFCYSYSIECSSCYVKAPFCVHTTMSMSHFRKRSTLDPDFRRFSFLLFSNILLQRHIFNATLPVCTQSYFYAA